MKSIKIYIQFLYNQLCFEILCRRIDRLCNSHFVNTPQHSTDDDAGEIQQQQYRFLYQSLYFRRGIRWRKMHDLRFQLTGEREPIIDDISGDITPIKNFEDI